MLDDTGYNAFAYPAIMCSSQGLIDAAPTGRAGRYLAHEITHVTAKHHLHAMRKTAQSGVFTARGLKIKTNALGNLVASQFLAGPQPLRARPGPTASSTPTAAAWPPRAPGSTLWPGGRAAATARPRPITRCSPWPWRPPARTGTAGPLEQAMGKRLDGYAGAAPVTVAQRLADGSRRNEDAQRRAGRMNTKIPAITSASHPGCERFAVTTPSGWTSAPPCRSARPPLHRCARSPSSPSAPARPCTAH